MPSTRSMTRLMAESKAKTKSSGCHTTSGNHRPRFEEASSNLFEQIRNESYVRRDTDTAHLNLIRLFYLDQTRSLIPTKLYDNTENPQIKLNLKITVCWLLSHPNLDRDLLEVAESALWRAACQALKAESNLSMDHIRLTLLPIREQFDDIADHADLPTIEAETLYQQFKGVFISERSLAGSGQEMPIVQCLLNREEAGRYLAQTYGESYTEFDWSHQIPALLTYCLDRPYDAVEDSESELDIPQTGKAVV